MFYYLIFKKLGFPWRRERMVGRGAGGREKSGMAWKGGGMAGWRVWA